MDFWDVARLMWRRWYVTAPALLLTAAAAVWVAVTVEPDYQVTGHIAVVGPSIQRSENDTGVTRVNPWSSEALADAAAIRLQGKPLADELKAEGFSGEWGAQVTGRLPVIRLEVVAERPEYAQATLERLREVIDEEVRSRQAEHNVAPEEQITTVSYDGGETVEPVTGKVKRALMVAVAAGLLLTTGAVVAFDAIIRRRAAKAPAPPEPAGEPARARYTYGTARPPAAPPTGLVTGRQNGRVPTGPHEEPPVRIKFVEQPNAPVSPPPSPAVPVPPDDSTVILPLSNPEFLQQQAGGRQPDPDELSTEVRTS